MHDLSKQEKVPARANPVWITHNLPPGRWGRSDLCRDDTSGAPRHGWPCLAVSCASGWAKKHATKRRLTAPRCHSVRSGSRFIKNKNSSQYGPYVPATFHACAVTSICRIPKRPLQHSFQGNHLEKRIHADCPTSKINHDFQLCGTDECSAARTTSVEHFSIKKKAALGA